MRETPGYIPNPEAKPHSADGTAGGTLWESRTPPNNHCENPRAIRHGGFLRSGFFDVVFEGLSHGRALFASEASGCFQCEVGVRECRGEFIRCGVDDGDAVPAELLGHPVPFGLGLGGGCGLVHRVGVTA